MEKISRRQLLRSTAATGAGLLMGGSGFPALAQEKEELDLPVGTAGKLTVIHRTEYFEAAQTVFRETVEQFAAANNVELDISTTNPESFGDFLGKMTAAVKAGNPPDFAYTTNVSISQMHLLDLVEDVTDVVDEAVKPLRQHHAGHQRRQERPVRRQVEGRSRSSAARTALPVPRRQAHGKGHRSGHAARPSTIAARRRWRSPSRRLLRLGPHPQPVAATATAS